MAREQLRNGAHQKNMTVRWKCKQWRAQKVGVEVVRELFGLISAEGAAGGFVVTSGRFTNDAKAFADGRQVELIDGERLHRQIVGTLGETLQSSNLRSPVAYQKISPVAPSACMTEVPMCPKCSTPMVRRDARRGPNAGSEFWGCSNYPKCTGIRPLSQAAA